MQLPDSEQQRAKMVVASTYPQPELDIVILLVAAFVLAIVLSVLPPLSYPLRLLFTILHELSHGIAALATGGQFKGFVASPTRGGVALTEGGTGCLVAPAGYLGVTFISAGLVLLSGIPGTAPYVLGSLGVLLTLLVLGYGRSSALTLISGLIWGLGLVWVALKADEIWSIFLLNLLAIFGCFRAIGGLLILNEAVRLNDQANDAENMANAIGCPALFWSVLWAFLSAIVLYLAFSYTWLSRWQYE